MDSNYEQLSYWILDEEKYITCSYLLRNTELNVTEVQSLIERFLKEHVDNKDVNASYFVVGTISDEDGMAGGIARKKSVICRDVDLDATKKSFLHIDSCSLYSVQAKPLTDFNVLFNASWLDTQVYLSPTREKTLVRNPLAVDTYQRWKESHKDEENRLEQSSVRSIFVDKMKNEAKSREDQRMTKKINQLFAKSVKKTESPEKKKPTSPKPKLKTAIRIDSDDDNADIDAADEREPLKARATKRKSCNSLFNSDEEEQESTKESDGSRRISAIDKDVFCTGEDSSPEKWHLEENVNSADAVDITRRSTKVGAKRNRKSGGTEKTKRQLKGKNATIKVSSDENEENKDDHAMDVDDEVPTSFFKSVASSTTSSADKRREKVMKSYIDDDGFEVTEMVTQEVDDSTNVAGGDKEELSIEREAARPAKSSAGARSSNGGALKSSSAAKKKAAPAGQAKISSFFKKT